MNFKEAFELMKKGMKVKRPSWGGYWCIEDETIKMYCKDGTILDLFSATEKMYTLENIAADDFIVADKDNTVILGGELIFDFSTALKYLKRGHRMSRKGWNGKGLSVVYQKGYPEGIPCNKQTAEAWGLKEGDIFKCEPYLQISTTDNSHAMWVPSIRDCLAEDWYFAD